MCFVSSTGLVGGLCKPAAVFHGWLSHELLIGWSRDRGVRTADRVRDLRLCTRRVVPTHAERVAAQHPGNLDVAGLEVLDRGECLRLLAMGGVGRVALPAEPPVVRPVNFVLDEERIVIRTGASSTWRAASEHRLVTFEIDGARNLDHRGWSVVATGPLMQLAPDDRVLALPLRAWAPRGRERFVAITIRELTGRRLTGRP